MSDETNTKKDDPPKARPGISPLDLLLDQMREAWEDARRLRAEGLVLKGEGFAMELGQERTRKLVDAGEKMLAAVAAEKKARELAKDAAPYQHAKLSNTQAHLTGDVTIHRKSF